ncbi:MAG: mandelate racemase [Robiginitomaculum sp.]|nr:MAG: mandelate racemase [Robiginitomaculum sp.]
MATITKIEICMVDLVPPVKRTDAIQSFVSQETPIVTITDSEGATGTGYCYTIGTGGAAIISLLKKTLVPELIGRNAECIEQIWRDLLMKTHATAVGALTSLALAAIDIALWDLRCRKAGLPLYRMAGGAKNSVAMYTTEGGWLHISTDDLVRDALAMQAKGFAGAKIKIGSPHISTDRARLAAVREAVGPGFDIMVDANQSFSRSEAIKRGRMLEEFDISWFEEPLPADDICAHAALSRHVSVPIAVGESMYSLSQFKDYLVQDACSIVQVDVARIGGITPWLKTAHMSEGFNISVCPHFLMELHVSLVCAVPNAPFLEYIPQLDSITKSGMRIKNGRAYPSETPGIGIVWDWGAIAAATVEGSGFTFTERA